MTLNPCPRCGTPTHDDDVVPEVAGAWLCADCHRCSLLEGWPRRLPQVTRVPVWVCPYCGQPVDTYANHAHRACLSVPAVTAP